MFCSFGSLAIEFRNAVETTKHLQMCVQIGVALRKLNIAQGGEKIKINKYYTFSEQLCM